MLRVLALALVAAVVAAWVTGLEFLAVPVFLAVLGIGVVGALRGTLVLKCPWCGKRVKLGYATCHHCGRSVRRGE